MSKELSERDRKIKEIKFLYEQETKKCNLCKNWREENISGSYIFCVEHWKKYEEKRDKEMEEWDNQNIKDGQD